MPRNRSYTIEFYKGQYGDPDKNLSLGKYLLSLAEKGECHSHKLQSTRYCLNHFKKDASGCLLFGQLGKFRDSDVPHIGSADGQEREIGMNDEEGLVEKNFFLYDTKLDVLVWHRNNQASWAVTLSKFLMESSNETVTLDPVLQIDQMERFMNGKNNITKLEIGIARPNSSEAYNSIENENLMLDIMSENGAYKLDLELKGNGHAKGGDKYLDSRAYAFMKRLVTKHQIDKAKVVVHDELRNISHPIDLVADRLLDKIKIEVTGRYPDRVQMKSKLMESYSSNKPIIDKLFK